MDLLHFISNSNTLIGIGTVIFAISYIIRNFVLGTSSAEEKANAIESKTIQATKTLTDTYERQLGFEREERTKMQDRMLGLEKQISEMQGKLTAYQELIKNPVSLEESIKSLTETMQKVAETTYIAAEASKFMQDVRSGRLEFPKQSSVTVKETKVV